ARRPREAAGWALPPADGPRDGLGRARLGAARVRARARAPRPARPPPRAPAVPPTAPRLGAIPATYRLDLMPYNSPASMLGLPVTVVPCGLVDRLPVGLALTGRRGEDGVPLAAAERFQRTTDWHLRRPVDRAEGGGVYTNR